MGTSLLSQKGDISKERAQPGRRPCRGGEGYAIMGPWNGPRPVFFMSGALRPRNEDGKKRESRDGYDGLHRVQTP